ncbi:DNA-directed DNA polymerase type II [Salinarchaeum sp. Harcht-Bsk1]|uniref:DNA-directed DNA polymerase n=1 Tax=Salinarchaeum sp. Harcht-Bsk1 TaxID=1333523 RepID=UPI00034246BD|nr:DNA-directed DNA polymerase [Salinarchaeum sp. Harcht-Bsk1]AGN00390.1 DNA-directed DNA polymerase type II [Salinarchaeum sp. Harcht-Bsk1]
MTDAGQQDLSSWADSGEDARPEAEAEYVAGADDGASGDVVDPMVETLPDAQGTVDLRVMQVDYTIEGSGSDETPIVHVFGRTADGEREHVRVRGFQPYFYVPVDSVDPNELATYDGIVDYEEGGFESIRGDDLLKIYGRTPRDVGQVRDEFDHYEADVLFPNRFLIDHGVESGIRVPARREDGGASTTGGGAGASDGGNSDGVNAPITIHHEEVEPVDVLAEPRVHTLDIEVDDRSGFPEDGEEPIVCLTTHDSVRDEYVGWVFPGEDAEWGGDVGDLDYDPITDDAAVEVRTFESEAAMLDAYLTYVEETDPDVMTGWNFDDFDMPYVLDRLEEVGSWPDVDEDLSIERLSRVDEVWRSNWGAPDVKGRVVFDLLYAYQRTQFSELDSYRLDAVAEEELGVGKERYTGDLGDLWEQDPERLLEYNVRDVELCVELDRKQDVIAFWDEVRTFVGCKLEDATTPGDAVDMYVLHKVNGEFVLPSKGQQESEDYEGGAVFDPITGVREMVSVLDLKSLYPMCMVTTNASPETKVDPANYDGETFVAPNGTHFQKEPDGIIREMVDELLSERESKKAARNEHDPDSADYDRFDRQQAAVKVIMNSLYGVLGWERFRLYDKEMGAAVTATGREVIEFTEEAANDIGHQVVYGDTDSVMLELGGDVSTEEAIEQSFEIEEHINGAYDEFALEELNAEEHRFQIEFEKLYRRFFQAGKKKRYAGHIVWKEGKEVDDVDITGFEYQRSDIAPITKEVQLEVIDMIVRGEPIDTVTDYVHETIDRFKNGDVDPVEVGIPGGIGKRLDNYDTDTAQVRGAKYANLMLGTNFDRGSKPKRLYLEDVHPEFFRRLENQRGFNPQEDDMYLQFKRDVEAGDGVICIEYADQLPEEFEIDWEKMLDKTLKGPIERILEALDVSWEEVESGQEQTGLSGFM